MKSKKLSKLLLVLTSLAVLSTFSFVLTSEGGSKPPAVIDNIDVIM